MTSLTADFNGLRVPFPFHQPRFDAKSWAVTPIEMTFQGKVRACGTGFLWREGKLVYLVTNWHNVSGQDPFNGRHLSHGGVIPDSINAYPTILNSEGDVKTATREKITLQLFEEFHAPKWVQSRYFNELRIDIAALELRGNCQEYVVINSGTDERLFVHVGVDVFIVGYPCAVCDDLKSPIWKRGSIASEPLAGWAVPLLSCDEQPGLYWKRMPAFLVDAASREGMSGSPVFRRIFGPSASYQDQELVVDASKVMATEFVGVYSGRLSEPRADLSIGIAWYGSLVSEVINNPAPGSRLSIE